MPSARSPKSLIIAGVALGDMKVAKTPIFNWRTPPVTSRHYTTGSAADSLFIKESAQGADQKGRETMPRALIRLAAAVMLVVASTAAFAETAFAETWPT